MFALGRNGETLEQIIQGYRDHSISGMIKMQLLLKTEKLGYIWKVSYSAWCENGLFEQTSW